ncbi:MAG: glycosyltransferase family 4 protein [Victivallaceae bacterium]
MRIATECLNRGHEVIVYTRSWDGAIPEGFDVRLIKTRAITNHGKAIAYYKQLQQELKSHPVSGIIGFNRMPGLDVYFAGDNCIAEKARMERNIFYRTFSPRFRTYCAMEKAVFAPSAQTEILILTERQKKDFITHYGTQEQRFHLLPPGIPEDRKRLPDADKIRLETREKNGIAKDDIVLIQVGSGFITKGVDRSIRAVAALPESIRRKTKLWIVGKDNSHKFVKLSQKLGIDMQVKFLGGCNNIPELLAAADLMIHPAINESAGGVLLEALTAGLPVLCSAACGYAGYIEKSGAGKVTPEPFSQANLNLTLTELLKDDLSVIGEKGYQFAISTDFYNSHKVATDIIEKTIAAKNILN